VELLGPDPEVQKEGLGRTKKNPKEFLKFELVNGQRLKEESKRTGIPTTQKGGEGKRHFHRRLDGALCRPRRKGATWDEKKTRPKSGARLKVRLRVSREHNEWQGQNNRETSKTNRKKTWRGPSEQGGGEKVPTVLLPQEASESRTRENETKMPKGKKINSSVRDIWS